MDNNSGRNATGSDKDSPNKPPSYSLNINNKNSPPSPRLLMTNSPLPSQRHSVNLLIDPNMLTSSKINHSNDISNDFINNQSISPNIESKTDFNTTSTSITDKYIPSNPKVYTLTDKVITKVDNKEIPRPVDSLTIISEENGNIPSYYTSEIFEPIKNLDSCYLIDDGNASPMFIRPTLYQIPRFADSLENSHFKFAIIVQPFAPTPVGQEIGIIDINGLLGIEDPQKQYLIRCKSCGAYINSFVLSKMDSNGCICNLCGTKYDLNFRETEILTNLCNESNRNPRILRGSVDFLAPVTYYTKKINKENQIVTGMRTLSLISQPLDDNPAISSARSIPTVRTSMTEPVIHENIIEYHSKPCHIILIDCNKMAKKLNIKASVIQGIKYTLSHEIINDFDQSELCIITFTDQIQFFSYRFESKSVLMVSADDPVIPCPLDDLFINIDLVNNQDLINDYLNYISKFEPYIDYSRPCGMSAIQIAIQILVEKATSGTITIFQAEPSNIHVQTEDEKVREAEVKKILNGIILQCYDSNIAIDYFYCLPTETLEDFYKNTYIPVQTGGRFKIYSMFDYRRDYISLYQEIYRNLTTRYAYGCELRLRCNKGIAVKEFLCPQSTPKAIVDKHTLKVPRISPDTSIAFILGMDDIPESRNAIYLQSACLHLNSAGKHCVRVHTFQLSLTNSISKMYKFSDVECIANIYMRILAYNMLKFNNSLRMVVLDEVIGILSSYRRLCASSTPANQLILPDALKLLPPYIMAAFKLIAMHSNSQYTHITNILYKTLSCSVSQSMYIFPKLYSLGREYLLKQGNIKFELIPTSGEYVYSDGLYLLDNGFEIFLYFGLHVPLDILKELFGSHFNNNNWMDVIFINKYNENIIWVDAEITKSEFADKVQNCIDQLTQVNKSDSFKRLLIIAPRTRGEEIFKTYLIEDSYKREPSYMSFLCDIHSKIHSKNDGKGVAKVFSKSAEVFFLQTVKCISNLLPSPSDYPTIESFLYNTGYYDRLTFTLYVQISKITLPKTKHKYQISIKSNNESHEIFTNDYIKSPLDMTFKVTVKPFDTFISIEIIEKKLIVEKTIASLKFDIENSIISLNFPKNNIHEIFDHDTRPIGSITLSFYHVPCLVNLDSELWHKAAVKFVNDEPNFIEFLEDLYREDKIYIMSSLLKGQLYIQSNTGIGWEDTYSIVECIEDRYYWNLYENESSLFNSEKPKVEIPILSIRCVNLESKDTFKITYVKTDGDVELICKHDLPGTWVGASNSYIQMLRRHLEHLPIDIFNIDANIPNTIKSTVDHSLDESNKLPESINEMYAFMNS